ncbi:hypothetical protein O181_058187 [Austropuccinia psidii MF-1]|uniref:Uncharacterized protein n=1 Tax=Austropuccinia psidii MF-1 TaxID=1389203 RepID=A0A9Q3HW68_9BASI|nr:hypothetical protein [Austropuccinia psidii MF-1]
MDTPKGEDLILVFDIINHFNPSIDFRKELMTFNTDNKDYNYPSNSSSNNLSSSNTCAALVSDSRTPSFSTSVHSPCLNSHHSLLSSGDEVFHEIKDVGEDNSIFSLHLFHWNVDLPP